VNAVQADPWLSSNYPTPEPAAGLPNLAFDALYFGQFGNRGAGSSALARFSLTKGPDFDSLILLPGVRRPGREAPFRRLVVEPSNGIGYGLSSSEIKEVVEIDLAKKSTRLLPAIPREVWKEPLNPRGIAFDARRQRLLLATHQALFAYTTTTGKWEVVREWVFPGFAGLAFDPASDNVYVLWERFGHRGDEKLYLLERLSNKGEQLGEVQLSGPLFAGALESGDIDSRAQFIAVGDMLVLVSSLLETSYRPVPQTEVETFVYLIDPKSGKTLLAWKDISYIPLPGRGLRPQPPGR
jgi:hypothetical protein